MTCKIIIDQNAFILESKKIMNQFGFKKITAKNWKQRDSLMSYFKGTDQAGRTVKVSGGEWVEAILGPEIGKFVPDEIRSLFEVARGSMIYGYFFYPLFTLSAEQLFRVVDAAVAHKCKILNAPKSKKTFYKRVEWLIENSVIDKADRIIWESARKLRNSTSHPTKQMILTPANAIGLLSSTAEHINKLFTSDQ